MHWLKSIVDRLRRSAREDPGKAAILGLLIVVMVVLWMKVLGGDGQGPATARAQDSSRPKLEANVLPAAVQRSASAVEQGAMFQEWLEAAVRPVDRDLFAVRLEYFPTNGSRMAGNSSGTLEGFWEQLEKSTAAQADQRRERQILVENLRRQASQLKLQTIVMGEKPKALINGEPVGEGDVVASFRVIRIDARRVVIERENIRFELHMK